MTKKERYQLIIEYFRENNPAPETELIYRTPYELLVAVILSAQCTDKRVNLVTPPFFEQFPDIESLANAEIQDIFRLIKSVSYPNNKARHLAGMAKMLLDDFGGKIPMTVDELVKLPGVGRKTANVVTSVIDQQPNMAVDTHVFRVSARIGLTTAAKTPGQAEKQLVKHIPPQYIHHAHHWLILHGRYVCTARSPKCSICGIKTACKYYTKRSAIP